MTKIPHSPSSLPSVRKAVYAIIGLGIVAVVVIGLVQSSGKDSGPPKLVSRAPSAAEARPAFAGSPPALDSLHRRAHRLVPGGQARLQAGPGGPQGPPGGGDG